MRLKSPVRIPAIMSTTPRIIWAIPRTKSRTPSNTPESAEIKSPRTSVINPITSFTMGARLEITSARRSIMGARTSPSVPRISTNGGSNSLMIIPRSSVIGSRIAPSIFSRELIKFPKDFLKSSEVNVRRAIAPITKPTGEVRALNKAGSLESTPETKPIPELSKPEALLRRPKPAETILNTGDSTFKAARADTIHMIPFARVDKVSECSVIQSDSPCSFSERPPIKSATAPSVDIFAQESLYFFQA